MRSGPRAGGERCNPQHGPGLAQAHDKVRSPVNKNDFERGRSLGAAQRRGRGYPAKTCASDDYSVHSADDSSATFRNRNATQGKPVRR